jgi:hypothetical protein
VRPAQRGQLAGAQCSPRAGDVGRQAHPPHSRGRSQRHDRQGLGQPPREIREVDPGAGADGVPCPHPRVDVEQQVLAVARIALELDLHQAGPPQGRDHRPPERLHPRLVHRLHQRARVAEVPRVLSGSPCRQVCHRDAVVTERGERVLRLAASGHELLHDRRLRAHQRCRLPPPIKQGGAIVHPPRLGAGKAVLVRLDVGLDDRRKPAVHPGHLGGGSRVPRARMRDADPLRQFVGAAFGVGLADGIPVRGHEGEPLRERPALLGDRSRRLIPRREQGPSSQAVVVGELQQPGCLPRAVAPRRREGPHRVARHPRHRVVPRFVQQPRGDAPAAEAPGDPQRSQVGADHQRPAGCAHGLRLEPIVAMTDVPALTRSPSATITDRSLRLGSTTSTWEPRRMIPIL